MAQFTLHQIDPRSLVSFDLQAEAVAQHDNPTLEAYSVVIDGQTTRAEVLYCGDRDSAGVAWGADAAWLEHVESAAAACHHAFDAV